MKDASLNRILLAAVIVLALGEVYLAHDNARLKQIIAVPGGIQSVSSVTPNPLIASTVVPITPSSILMSLAGVTKSVDGSHIVLENGSTTKTIAIDSSTTIVMQDKLKDSAKYADDVEAFRQTSLKLAQDPVQNKSALQSLIAPSSYTETTIRTTEIKSGAFVEVYYTIVGGEPHAFRVVVIAIPTP